MANRPSREKNIRQNEQRRARNRWRKQRFRTAIRQFNETLLHGTSDEARKQLDAIYKLLDQVASTGAIHKNTADRYKSRLTIRMNKKFAATASAA